MGYQYPKGHKKIGGRGKSSKNKKTILKEKIGISSWEKLEQYLTNGGAEKFIEEIDTLSGKDFVICFDSAVQLVKPKLARTELSGKDGVPLIPFNITVTDKRTENELNKLEDN